MLCLESILFSQKAARFTSHLDCPFYITSEPTKILNIQPSCTCMGKMRVNFLYITKNLKINCLPLTTQTDSHERNGYSDQVIIWSWKKWCSRALESLKQFNKPSVQISIVFIIKYTGAQKKTHEKSEHMYVHKMILHIFHMYWFECLQQDRIYYVKTYRVFEEYRSQKFQFWNRIDIRFA